MVVGCLGARRKRCNGGLGPLGCKAGLPAPLLDRMCVDMFSAWFKLACDTLCGFSSASCFLEEVAAMFATEQTESGKCVKTVGAGAAHPAKSASNKLIF